MIQFLSKLVETVVQWYHMVAMMSSDFNITKQIWQNFVKWCKDNQISSVQRLQWKLVWSNIIIWVIEIWILRWLNTLNHLKIHVQAHVSLIFGDSDVGDLYLAIISGCLWQNFDPDVIFWMSDANVKSVCWWPKSAKPSPTYVDINICHQHRCDLISQERT